MTRARSSMANGCEVIAQAPGCVEMCEVPQPGQAWRGGRGKQVVEPVPRTQGQAGPVPLGRLLAQAGRLVSRLTEAVLAGATLTVDQWRVLDLLADRAGRSMSEIAGAVVVPGPTLTKIVDRLVDAALVYRLVDDRDRRRVLVFISDDGRALHQRLEPSVAEVEAQALGVLGTHGPLMLELLTRLAEDMPRALEPRP
jgi:DNA-binding MarR family transcriptional regulator